MFGIESFTVRESILRAAAAIEFDGRSRAAQTVGAVAV
jgi:hypothetical protein